MNVPNPAVLTPDFFCAMRQKRDATEARCSKSVMQQKYIAIEAARAQCENKKCLSYHLYKEMERNGEKTFYIRVRYRRTSG